MRVSGAGVYRTEGGMMELALPVERVGPLQAMARVLPSARPGLNAA